MKLRINLDPAAWKIVAGAVAIILTDLGEALAAVPPSENLTRLQVVRIIIHAVALGFIFIGGAGEEKKPA